MVKNYDDHTINVLNCIPHRLATFTDLSVHRGFLALKGFLGSESSWLCTGTVRMPSMEAAGKSQDRWHCAA